MPTGGELLNPDIKSSIDPCGMGLRSPLSEMITVETWMIGRRTPWPAIVLLNWPKARGS